MTQSPFRAKDLEATTQRIRQHIEFPWNELRNQPDLVELAEPEDRLCHGIESLGMSPPLLT